MPGGPRVDQRMYELRRERQHGEEQGRGGQGYGARGRLAAPGRRTQGTADHHRRRPHLDQVRRGEQRVETDAVGDEDRRPERLVDDPGRAEDQRRGEGSGLPVGQGAIPRAALAEPGRKAGEQVQGQQGP